MADSTKLIPSIESDAGDIILRPNRGLLGYQLAVNTEGLGAAIVDNEVLPKLGNDGAILGAQRVTEGDMFLPIIIRGKDRHDLRQLIQDLTKSVRMADGSFRFVITDPIDGSERYRDVVYREGLETPVWQSPVSVKFGLTVDYVDPWVYSKTRSTTTMYSAIQQGSAGWVSPFVFPLVSGGLSEPIDASIVNNGDRPAPLRVTFGGQATAPRIRDRRSGTIIGVRGSMAWDERITIDSKAETVEHWRIGEPNKRLSVPGRLLLETRLTKMFIPPGEAVWQYRAQSALESFAEISAPSTYTALG